MGYPDTKVLGFGSKLLPATNMGWVVWGILRRLPVRFAVADGLADTPKQESVPLQS